jgi:TolA-binding protein
MRLTLKAALLLTSIAVSSTSLAQSNPLDLRVGKLEKEMKAVQRTVFPQGVPVQPELGGTTTPGIAAGDAATTPLSDLTARVETLEKSLSGLTGQIEQAVFRNKQQDDMIQTLETRLKALEGNSDAGAVPATITPKPATAPATLTTPKPTAATKPPAVAPTKNDPARKAAVAAIEIPSTGDAPEDAYTYGFRLYTAKFYPEAQTKLKEFVAKYPTHRRASYAQNLLGRAYYDEGKPALASVAFYDNYQKMPNGERASESLYWLGQSLTRLKKLPDACKVYDELQDVYGAKMTADLKTRAAKGRVDAKCTA